MSEPVVSILLTNHLDENAPYLHWALASALCTINVPYEVILLSDSKTYPKAPSSVRVVHDYALDTATKKTHHGVKVANPNSKYFLLMSDDVILSRTALAEMVAAAGDNDAIINPMSNSDLGGRFYTPLHAQRGMVRRQLNVNADLKDVEGWEGDLIRHETPFRSPLLVKQDWVSFYCTLIPRKTWDRVGLLDERLETRHNDQDYCLRAAQLGIPSLICFNAFAFHFGTKTLSKICRPGEQDEATRVFVDKWRSA